MESVSPPPTEAFPPPQGAAVDVQFDESLTEKQRSLEVLTRVGILIPTDGLSMFHGRAAEPAAHANWKVDAEYENKRHGQNIHTRKSLYATPNKDDARAFAGERASWMTHQRQKQLLADEVRLEDPETVRQGAYERAHKKWTEQPFAERTVVSLKAPGVTKVDQRSLPEPLREQFGHGPIDDKFIKSEAHDRLPGYGTDAARELWQRASQGIDVFVEEIVAPAQSYLVNGDLDITSIAGEDANTVINTVNDLFVSVGLDITHTEARGVIAAEDRQSVIGLFIEKFSAEGLQARLTEDDITALAAASRSNLEQVRGMAASCNAMILLMGSLPAAASRLLETTDAITPENVTRPEVPVSIAYIEKFFDRLNIVGYKSIVESGTLKMAAVDTIALFALDKIEAKAKS